MVQITRNWRICFVIIPGFTKFKHTSFPCQVTYFRCQRIVERNSDVWEILLTSSSHHLHIYVLPTLHFVFWNGRLLPGTAQELLRRQISACQQGRLTPLFFSPWFYSIWMLCVWFVSLSSCISLVYSFNYIEVMHPFSLHHLPQDVSNKSLYI